MFWNPIINFKIGAKLLKNIESGLEQKNIPLICVFCDFIVFLQNILEL